MAVLAAAGVRRDQVTSCRELVGGTFNAVYLVRRADGGGLVVKLAPDQAGPLLWYERGILATEAMYYQAAARQAGVTVPSVIVEGRQSCAVVSVMAWSRMARPSASSSSVAVRGGAIRKTPPMPGS